MMRDKGISLIEKVSKFQLFKASQFQRVENPSMRFGGYWFRITKFPFRVFWEILRQDFLAHAASTIFEILGFPKT